ncbi:MAG: helix-turn-helix domain-containing protein, partial [bacterium]
MIGEKIKTLRERLGFSQEDLSERARINRSYLSHIENGKSVPTIEVAERIAKGLGVPLSELLSDKENHHYNYDTEEQTEMYDGLREFLNDP